MVTDDFNIEHITLFKTETYTPLVVNTDAPLSDPVAF